jgi:adenine-specific DNA-methyltransferase
MSNMQALHTIDERRKKIAGATTAKRKSELGQFMTPTIIARFMSSMFAPLTGKKIRLIDAGAGIGSLTAAFVERTAIDHAVSLQCDAWEIDPYLHEDLRITLKSCKALMAISGVDYKDIIKKEDFITVFSDIFSVEKLRSHTHAILNPPYKKINSDSAHRMALRSMGIETSNLYAAFVALALKSLEVGGEIVAITPRSFCNGPYFRQFREYIFHTAALTKVHIFESRTQAFKGDEVLQENVIFHLVKGQKQGEVIITSSADATFSDLKSRTVPFTEIVASTDKNMVINLVAEDDTKSMAEGMRTYTQTLEELGLRVSTGPVVDFRLREHLRPDMEDDCAPLIYPHHFENGFIAHPKQGAKKPNAIKINTDTGKWLMPSGNYTIVRRLSSKEEKRRIVPAVFNPTIVPGEKIGFENHLNVFHSGKKGLPPEIAKGLAIYLGSTFVDQWLRRFSGHTQVNASDLRSLRYPSMKTLETWGKTVGNNLPNQELIDLIVKV